MRHLLEIDDVIAPELEQICGYAKADVSQLRPILAGRGVAALFAKASARTRNSTEMAVVQLGGHPIYITDDEVGIDTRETAEDIARTLACYHAFICARVNDHRVLERMAAVDLVPVVNLLSNEAHPLQAIADVLTIQAEYGTVQGATVAYIGDVNNVARSLAMAVGFMGGKMAFAAPHGYGFSPTDRERLAMCGVEYTMFSRPEEAVAEANVVYTDTWVSMGQEGEREDRMRAFEGYTVDERLMGMSDGAIFMHCLPAYRGQEVSAGVIDGARSRVWWQAANRLAAVRGVLLWLDSISRR